MLPLVLLIATIVVAAIVGIRFFSQSTLHISRSIHTLADDEMNAVRRRFGPSQPCLERPDGAGPNVPGEPIHTVHMLAWSPGDRLVRGTTPYWALRAGAWKIRFARAAVPILEYVTLADVERCGRGVLIDRPTNGDGRIVIWAE